MNTRSAFFDRNLGDHKSVGGGVREARVMFGPGYRICFAKDGAQLVLLLLGGDKPRHNPTQDTLNRLLKPFPLRLSLAPLIAKPRRTAP